MDFMPKGQFYETYWRFQFSGSLARLLMPEPLPFSPPFNVLILSTDSMDYLDLFLIKTPMSP
jgi:hypothetical protein